MALTLHPEPLRMERVTTSLHMSTFQGMSGWCEHSVWEQT
jgi:hypothetical protein